MLVIGGVDRVNAAEHHWMNLLEAWQGGRGMARVRYRVAHFDFLRAFDIRGKIAGFAPLQLLARVWLRIEAADFLHLDVFARMQKLHPQTRSQLAIENADVCDHAFVGIEVRIESQRLN